MNSLLSEVPSGDVVELLDAAPADTAGRPATA
jgi:hypothetical protein